MCTVPEFRVEEKEIDPFSVQGKIIFYAKFAAQIAEEEGDKKFQEKAKSPGGHPILAETFPRIFADAEMK